MWRDLFFRVNVERLVFQGECGETCFASELDLWCGIWVLGYIFVMRAV